MKILVLCLPGIGDALMATPMIRALRLQYPKAQIDAACMFDTVAYLLKSTGKFDNIFVLPLYKKNGKKRFGKYNLKGLYNVWLLRRHSYDVSLLTFPAFGKEYHFVQWCIGAKKRIAHKFSKGYFSEWNFLDTDLVLVDEKVHNVINNLQLLSHFDGQNKTAKNNIFKEYLLNLSKKEIVFGKKYINLIGFSSKNTIGFHPGSIDSPAGSLKRWSKKNYVELAKLLIRQKKQILIFCGPFENDLCKEIIALVNDDKNCKIVNAISFPQTLGILKSCSLLIANDNGFAHIANALNVKSIVLFGPTNPLWCSPYNTKISIVIRNADFQPWFRNDLKVTGPIKDVQSGMEKISVKSVVYAIDKLVLR